MRPLLLALFPFLCCAQSLRVYAIDVEGGKATLYVSPSGESMLVDAGYDGFKDRDANRIAAAARDAGIKQIDYLVLTHYHKDHMGGVRQLAAKIPIGTFVDHGATFETKKDVTDLYNTYVAIRKKHTHVVVHAGDAIPVKGLDIRVVTAAGQAIASALPGGGHPNPLCADFKKIEPDSGENAHSIGFVLTYGNFRLVDLGDLYWNQEFDLACPANKLGTVDVYMSTHHGKKTSGSPAMVDALHPKAAIMNNGPETGASVEAWQTLHDAPGSPDIWQLHYAKSNGPERNAQEAMIANLHQDDCAGSWIKLTAHADGTFEVRNGRNGFGKQYE